MQGKFSLHYPLAAALLDGKCALATFTDEYVQRKEIATLYERIDAAENPACRGDDPLFETRSSGSKGFVEVEIHLSNGKSETIRVDKAPGSPTRAPCCPRNAARAGAACAQTRRRQRGRCAARPRRPA